MPNDLRVLRLAERHAVIDWILARLAEGPVPSRTLYADAVSAGHSRSAVWRARNWLAGRVRTRKGAGAYEPWFWELVEVKP